jgi:hypothetical protein
MLGLDDPQRRKRLKGLSPRDGEAETDKKQQHKKSGQFHICNDSKKAGKKEAAGRFPVGLQGFVARRFPCQGAAQSTRVPAQ